MIDLAQWLTTVEWVDNHAVSTILACQRKAYFHYVGFDSRGGLASGVGSGANFGTCIHAGRAAYYDGRRRALSEKDCLRAAIRCYSASYVKLFGSEDPDPRVVQKKHFHDNGLTILANYFQTHLFDDQRWDPVETELAAVFPFRYRDGDCTKFTPFFYLMRCDGLWRLRESGDLYVNELKTTGGGVDREITRRKVDRQTTGYSAVLSSFPGGERIAGVLLDVIGVYVEKRECRREVEMKTLNDHNEWRQETIRIVSEWRERKAKAQYLVPYDRLSLFYRNDNECTKYGLCPFWKGCYEIGKTGVAGLGQLEDLPSNTWSPLATEKEDSTI